MDIDNISIRLKPHSNKYCILSINIQGINAQFDTLLELLTFYVKINSISGQYASGNHGQNKNKIHYNYKFLDTT